MATLQGRGSGWAGRDRLEQCADHGATRHAESEPDERLEGLVALRAGTREEARLGGLDPEPKGDDNRAGEEAAQESENGHHRP